MNKRPEFPKPADVSGLSDHDLIALARKMSQDGYRGLVRRYEPAVIERIYDLVRDQDLTHDVLQTTWEKAVAALQKTEPRNFEAWILRIAYNAAIDELRKKRPDADRRCAQVNSAGIELHVIGPGVSAKNSLIGVQRNFPCSGLQLHSEGRLEFPYRPLRGTLPCRVTPLSW